MYLLLEQTPLEYAVYINNYIFDILSIFLLRVHTFFYFNLKI